MNKKLRMLELYIIKNQSRKRTILNQIWDKFFLLPAIIILEEDCTEACIKEMQGTDFWKKQTQIWKSVEKQGIKILEQKKLCLFEEKFNSKDKKVGDLDQLTGKTRRAARQALTINVKVD